ncbi:GreA/GreB family elongation factor [Methylobacillus flagellatus]|uniref:GreA/GreB family elongation factor n=1 Tax=Methylobacillus flagellatus TaxID=405 RepID=UPI001BB1EA72|nr:GreA/GreB family elongation factor [Methylobacillus flagellatus]
MLNIPLSNTERMLTELDYFRLSKLDKLSYPIELEDGLDSAEVVDSAEIPDDVVTMNSLFVIADDTTGHRTQLRLCYPGNAAPAQGNISVLSPAGASMLGLRRGAIASWRSLQGEVRFARIVELLFQPEAAGDYSL